MAAKPTALEKLRTLLRAKQVTTLAQMARRMHCSQRTVQRRLHELKAINSYNKNGRYYVLPDVPQFDVHGLWHYGAIGFSRYGNLTKTVIELIRNSPAGFTSAELGLLLKVEARSFLSLFRDHAALQRELDRGRFVYFAGAPAAYDRQMRRRRTMTSDVQRPTDAEALAILVEAIKHSHWSVEQICRQLNNQGIRVTEQAALNLFADHDIVLKKTPRFP